MNKQDKQIWSFSCICIIYDKYVIAYMCYIKKITICLYQYELALHDTDKGVKNIFISVIAL